MFITPHMIRNISRALPDSNSENIDKPFNWKPFLIIGFIILITSLFFIDFSDSRPYGEIISTRVSESGCNYKLRSGRIFFDKECRYYTGDVVDQYISHRSYRKHR